MLTPVNPRVGSGKDYQIVKFVRIIKGVEGGTKKTHSLAGAAGEEASLRVVFLKRNVSTAMPDLDSETESYF
jgi:hypothetical protein